MQSPTASDPSFKAFLEKLQEQNTRGFATQLVQLKAEREIAGEDDDKREEQLDEVISSLKEVKNAVTGIKIDLDITPLVNIGENQTKLLDEIFKESSLTRKLTEGSVEYSKEMAGYRNTSGRDVTNEVSGKVSKTGQVIDFETARDALSAQGKRAKEANAFDLKPINYTPGKTAAAAVSGGKGSAAANKDTDEDKSKFQGLFKEIESGFKFFMTDGLSEKPGHGIFQTPSKDVEKKEREAKVSSPRQENPEGDNITSTGEIEADAAKSDLELSKQMLDTTREQLTVLKEIRDALAPKTPRELTEQKGAPSSTTEKEKEEGGGSLLGNLASGAMDLLGSGKKAAGSVVGKAAGLGGKILGGAQALGGKAVSFANSGAGKLLGSAAAVGLGAYTAYQGYTAAEDSKQAKLEDVQAKVDAGQLSPEDAAAQRKDIGNSATVEKSGAVGEGTGMAAGAIAGAQLGATIGTFVGGPVGTAVGGLAGGALGAFAGSKAGKVVGEYGGKAINAAGEFGSKAIDTVGEYGGKAISAAGSFFGGIGDKVKGAYGDARETVEQAKNFAGDTAYTVGATAGANIDKYTGLSKQIGKAKEFLGIKPDTSQVSDSTGTNTFDKEGNLIKQASPTFMGSSTETDVRTGDVTSKYSQGPMDLAQTKFAAGGSQTTGSYDLGTAIVKTRKTLTAKQQAEADKANGIEPAAAVVEAPATATSTVTGGSAFSGTGKVNTYLDEMKERGVNPADPDGALRLGMRGPNNAGNMVAQTSTENADMERDAKGKGGANNTVVSNNVSSNNTTKIVPMKASPRPEYTGSALDRYTSRIAVY